MRHEVRRNDLISQRQISIPQGDPALLEIFVRQ